MCEGCELFWGGLEAVVKGVGLVVVGFLVGGVKACSLSTLTLLAMSAGRHETEAGRSDDDTARLHRAVGGRCGEDNRS